MVSRDAADAAALTPSPVKPRLRGWLHAGWTPVVVLGSLVLVILAPTTTVRWTTAVYAATAVALFATSAVYHLGTWTPRTGRVLRRLDHANIFLVIAGSYTPLTALVLPGLQAQHLLTAVWTMALAGVVFKVVFVHAPRWVGVPIYLILGWAALAYLPSFWRHGGPAVLGLIVAGGLLYTAGAVVYALRRPDPNPAWFGFHEVFHAFTIAAFSCHFAAIALVVSRLR